MSALFWQDGAPITMQSDARGRPLRFQWQGQQHIVDQICNRWRIDEGWWRGQRQTAWKEYIKLTTTDGLLCLLAHDLRAGSWALVRVYD